MNLKQFSESLYFFGLVLLVAAMPLSIFMMSLSQFIIIGSWLMEGKSINKVKSAFKNPVVAVLTAVYFMHLVGGFYSTDYNYFFNDVRIKLPMLLLPVIIFTSPKISQKQFEAILSIFVLAVLTSSIISIGVLLDMLPHKNKVKDIRDISVFVSHIRLSLFVCLSVFICVWFAVKRASENIAKRIALILLISWFIIFLFILEAMTGLTILIATAIILLIHFMFSSESRGLKIATVFLLFAIPAALFFYIKNEAGKIYKQHTINTNNLPEKTINGNAYSHCLTCKDQENGNLTWLYVCEPELTSAWNQRSSLAYTGKDLAGHDLKYTLIRFLTSKGFTKDSMGVYSLTKEEMRSIENGIANAEYQKIGSLNIRLHKTIVEYYDYEAGKNPSGSSMMQRIEYWKTGWHIFTENFLFGVGTGDVQKSFDEEYVRSNSPLAMDVRHRAHNQYLTIAITFGIVGALFFIFSLFYPMLKLNMAHHYFYLTFFCIITLSMFTEDTLETQAGVTFFAFFNTFILLARRNSPS